MQEINAGYDRLFELLKIQHENNCSSDRTSTNNDYNNMKYDFEEDGKLRGMLHKIIKSCALLGGVSVISSVVLRKESKNKTHDHNGNEQFKWLLCPVCSSKTRIKMSSDTEL